MLGRLASRLTIGFIGVALLLLASRTASAADFRGEEETLYLDGTISKGDAEKLRGMLNAAPQLKRLSINSPGGDLAAGLELGEFVRSRKLETYVEGGVREAASAAAYVFMGGEIRTVKGTRGVGVHAFYTPEKEMRKLIKQKTSDDLVKTLNEFERATQESTMAVVEYVAKMIGDTKIVAEAVKSGSDAMLWPDTERLIAMKVATKKIELTPEETPDLEWLVDEVMNGLAAWLAPGYQSPEAPPAGEEPEPPLTEKGREILTGFLASERGPADLRAQLTTILERVKPANRQRAREIIILPAVRSTIRSIRSAADRAESAEQPSDAPG